MRAGWGVVFILLGGLLGSCAGCLRDTSYKCSSNDQCGAGGVCETSVGGFCSFADPDCGRRFGPSAGQYANQCVPGGPGSDGSGSGSDGSGSGSDGSGSGSDGSGGDPCMDFMTISGGATGVKYKMITTADNWVNQKTACGNLAPAHSSLAYPSNMGELTAMDTFAGGGNTPYWIGIDDLITSMVWKNSAGATQTYLPWDQGNGPSGNPNNKCVKSLGGLNIINDRCDTVNLPAMCECQ